MKMLWFRPSSLPATPAGDYGMAAKTSRPTCGSFPRKEWPPRFCKICPHWIGLNPEFPAFPKPLRTELPIPSCLLPNMDCVGKVAADLPPPLIHLSRRFSDRMRPGKKRTRPIQKPLFNNGLILRIVIARRSPPKVSAEMEHCSLHWGIVLSGRFHLSLVQ